jgi:hypothetical protein
MEGEAKAPKKLSTDMIADVVVTTITAALAPLNAKLAVVEQANRELRAEVTTLRERLAATEVKTELKSTVDVLTKQNGELRDRLVVLEAGAAVIHGR